MRAFDVIIQNAPSEYQDRLCTVLDELCNYTKLSFSILTEGMSTINILVAHEFVNNMISEMSCVIDNVVPKDSYEREEFEGYLSEFVYSVLMDFICSTFNITKIITITDDVNQWIEDMCEGDEL